MAQERVTHIRRLVPFALFDVKVLGASDEELMTISEERQLALSLDEMHRIQAFFLKEGRNPSDVEIEALAQAWSEHSCYKSSWPVLERTIFRIEAPQNILVIQEDSGVVDFDREHAYVVALESHNHPSALDPAGGAETGVGGILRDVLCMGAQPIALTDPLFFGPLDFPDSEVPKGTKHPRYLFNGVVGGIRDYGNRVGIPTVAGLVAYHRGYVGNCLVNVGCIGIVRKDMLVRSRAPNVGDLFVLAGGGTGRDGIHGVSSLASTVLRADSEEVGRTAVQMGDAITKEPLIHACLEAVGKGLVSGFKDLGGGGLSSAVGEMAYNGGNGCLVELDRVPLKVEGMAPWEIWVSESQERMMLAVSPKKVEEVLSIFRSWDVTATVIGEVITTKRAQLRFEGELVADLDLAFYTGAMRYERPCIRPQPKAEPVTAAPAPDLAKALLAILASPNVCSQEFVIRQYDHEVRAATILKPLQGDIWHAGPGDAAVIRPLPDSDRGLALTTDVNPAFMERDPYWGAASAVEESFRNLVAVGAQPHCWADNLNFGNPERPERMGEFVAAAEAMYFVAGALGVPCVSGNVSFYNESPMGPIPPTPTIFGIGVVEDVSKCVTSDMKGPGTVLYLVGETADEFGGSEYAIRVLGQPDGGIVPRCDPQAFRGKADRLLEAIKQGLVRACHDVSQGGIATAIAEMLIGGTCGAEVDLSSVPGSFERDDAAFFAESNGRWVVEVNVADAARFEQVMAAVACARIGSTMAEERLSIRRGGLRLEVPVEDVRQAWQQALPRLLGEVTG